MQLGLPLNYGKYSCIFRVSIFLSSLHNGMYLNKDVRSVICAEAATDFLLDFYLSHPSFAGANVSYKDPRLFEVLAKRLYGKLFADKGYISQKLFDFLFADGIQLVTGLRVNMKNKLMPFYDRMILRKRYIIETINDLLKNTAQIVH